MFVDSLTLLPELFLLLVVWFSSITFDLIYCDLDLPISAIIGRALVLLAYIIITIIVPLIIIIIFIDIMSYYINKLCNNYFNTVMH